MEKYKGPIMPPPKAKPIVFIPTLEMTFAEHQRLARTLGVLYPCHSNPTMEKMQDNLRTLSVEGRSHRRYLEKVGEKYFTHFPSEGELALAISRTSIPCRDCREGFRVCRWNGDEDDFFYNFPVIAWISIYGIPLHHWNRTDISKILNKFVHAIDIDEKTTLKMKMDCVGAYIGCEKLLALPRQFNVVFGRQLCSIKIEITCKIRVLKIGGPSETKGYSMGIPNPPATNTSVSMRERPQSASKVGVSYQPFTGVVTLPAGNRMSLVTDGPKPSSKGGSEFAGIQQTDKPEDRRRERDNSTIGVEKRKETFLEGGTAPPLAWTPPPPIGMQDPPTNQNPNLGRELLSFSKEDRSRAPEREERNGQLIWEREKQSYDPKGSNFGLFG